MIFTIVLVTVGLIYFVSDSKWKKTIIGTLLTLCGLYGLGFLALIHFYSPRMLGNLIEFAIGAGSFLALVYGIALLTSINAINDD